jgi:hypothetical protein
MRGFGEYSVEHKIDIFGPAFMNIYRSYFTADCNDEASLPAHMEHHPDYELTVDNQTSGEALYATMQGMTNYMIALPSYQFVDSESE